MKLFYDENGNVVGHFEGAIQEIEDNFGIPSNATGDITAPAEVAEAINDPYRDVLAKDFTVSETGEVLQTEPASESKQSETELVQEELPTENNSELPQ